MARLLPHEAPGPLGVPRIQVSLHGAHEGRRGGPALWRGPLFHGFQDQAHLARPLALPALVEEGVKVAALKGRAAAAASSFPAEQGSHVVLDNLHTHGRGRVAAQGVLALPPAWNASTDTLAVAVLPALRNDDDDGGGAPTKGELRDARSVVFSVAPVNLQEERCVHMSFRWVLADLYVVVLVKLVC